MHYINVVIIFLALKVSSNTVAACGVGGGGVVVALLQPGQ